MNDAAPKFAGSTVVFSLDLDWASDENVAWSLDLFREQGLPVTVFATHATPLLKEEFPISEIGIHPNFLRADGARSPEEIVARCLEVCPGAKGVRAHGLYEYADLMNVYRRTGLEWDSTQLLYLCPGIRPYRHPTGLVRLPIFWEDDDYFSTSPDWTVAGLNLESPGVKCFDFHPIHLRLNSLSPEQYSEAKKDGCSRAAVEKARYRGGDRGTLVFFRRLCDYVREHRITVSTIGKVCASC